jgi:hypothetical protein
LPLALIILQTSLVPEPGVTIDGAGHHVIVFGMTPFGVTAGESAKLQNLDIVGDSIAGGAIINGGVLQVTNYTLHDSYGAFGGAAIMNVTGGTLRVTNSTSREN